MVAGRRVFRHPAVPGRHSVPDKLTAFHRDHETGRAAVLPDLQAATDQFPAPAYAEEAKPLHEEPQRIHDGRRRGPQALGDIPPAVLARPRGRRGTLAGVRGVDPGRGRFASRERLLSPRGELFGKAWRSPPSPTPDTAPCGCSPNRPVWRAGHPNPREPGPRTSYSAPSAIFCSRSQTAASAVRTFVLVPFEHGTLIVHATITLRGPVPARDAGLEPAPATTPWSLVCASVRPGPRVGCDKSARPVR